MPGEFTKYLAIDPEEFVLRMNTDCVWKVTARMITARLSLDQGWPSLIIVHQIKIRYLVTFKLATANTLKVIFFNDDGIEVVNKCQKHEEGCQGSYLATFKTCVRC
ncbi:hypothetical protein VPH35_139474 [Triticum aestivum]